MKISKTAEACWKDEKVCNGFFDGIVDVYEHVEEKMMFKFETLTYSNDSMHFHLMKTVSNTPCKFYQCKVAKLKGALVSFFALILCLC